MRWFNIKDIVKLSPLRSLSTTASLISSMSLLIFSIASKITSMGIVSVSSMMAISSMMSTNIMMYGWHVMLWLNVTTHMASSHMVTTLHDHCWLVVSSTNNNLRLMMTWLDIYVSMMWLYNVMWLNVVRVIVMWHNSFVFWCIRYFLNLNYKKKGDVAL